MTSAARVWLITGASSGFGRAIAEAALDAGDTVIAAVRRPGAVADLVHRDPDRMRTLELDITDLSRIDAAVAEALTWQGRIDVLVNNAGRGMVGAVEATTDRELRDLMDLHFFGPAALTRAVLPHLRARGSGAIVQLTSMGGRLSFPGVGGYSATKFALEGWSEALAAEVAPFGVRVLIVEPGAFRTSFNGPQALAVTAVHEAYEDQIARVRANLSEGDGRQPGDPTKAAAAILQAVSAPTAPLRLPLGRDAVDMVRAALERSLADLAAWADLSSSTDFADAEVGA
jgi:NAD(P)-dependent dehydrogenase (short-subunit alcohol dehydrogenase family)